MHQIPDLKDSILSLTLPATTFLANDNRTRATPVSKTCKPNRVLMPIAPVPTLKIIMTAATADNTPAITIAHPNELLPFSDQPDCASSRPVTSIHSPKVTVSVFIVANKCSSISKPRAAVRMLQNSDIPSLSGLSAASQPIIPNTPAASTNSPNQSEMPASTSTGF